MKAETLLIGPSIRPAEKMANTKATTTTETTTAVVIALRAPLASSPSVVTAS